MLRGTSETQDISSVTNSPPLKTSSFFSFQDVTSSKVASVSSTYETKDKNKDPVLTSSSSSSSSSSTNWNLNSKKSSLHVSKPSSSMSTSSSSLYSNTSPHTPLSKPEFTSPLTRSSYSNLCSNLNKYTSTSTSPSPSLKREKSEYSCVYQSPSLAPSDVPSHSSERSSDVLHLSMQLMEMYRPMLNQLFEDLFTLNATEPYFLIRLFSILPYFSNHYTRQQLLLNLETLIQENQQGTFALTSSATLPLDTFNATAPSINVEPPTQRVPNRSNLSPDSLTTPFDQSDETKQAMKVLIERLCEGQTHIHASQLELVVQCMCEIMGKRFTHSETQVEFQEALQAHLSSYCNAPLSFHILDSMTNTLHDVCTQFIVQYSMQPFQETEPVSPTQAYHSEAELRLAEIMQIDRDLEDMHHQQKRLSEQLQKFELERQALFASCCNSNDSPDEKEDSFEESEIEDAIVEHESPSLLGDTGLDKNDQDIAFHVLEKTMEEHSLNEKEELKESV